MAASGRRRVWVHGLASTGIVLTALASGCGGGSGPPDGHRGADAAPPGAGALVRPPASDGRLVGAIVARPGMTRRRGGLERITGRSLLPPAGAQGGVGAEENCADADVEPTAQNLPHVADVLFCLMNAMRANADLPPLKQQGLLAQASVDHSQDMVSQSYFAHDSLDGRDVVARLK